VARLTQQADEAQNASPGGTGSDVDHTFVLLATHDDDPASWLRSGEAVQRVLLDLARLGWAASPVAQAIEVPVTRTRLRSALTWDAHPQMLLRIGRAEPTAPVPRRPRENAVAGRWQPPRPGPDPMPQGPPAGEAPHPQPDGRGGTQWIT
jgi:hypothetical protein